MKKESSTKVKNEAKSIAMKSLQRLSSCKYLYSELVMTEISKYTDNEKVKKEAYNQFRRAWEKITLKFSVDVRNG